MMNEAEAQRQGAEVLAKLRQLNPGYCSLWDRAAALPLFLVGGLVRDAFNNISSHDCDFIVDAEQISAVSSVTSHLQKIFGGTLVPLDKERGIERLVLPSGLVCDFALRSAANVTADLLNRDFTINAMALDLRRGLFVDPTGGRQDWEACRLRLVSEQALVNDPLRCLRAVRFLSKLRWLPSRELMAALKRQAASLSGIAAERKHYELDCCLANAFAEYWPMFVQSGLADELFPELRECQTQCGLLLQSCEKQLEKFFSELFPSNAEYLHGYLTESGAAGRTKAQLLKWLSIWSCCSSEPSPSFCNTCLRRWRWARNEEQLLAFVWGNLAATSDLVRQSQSSRLLWHRIGRHLPTAVPLLFMMASLKAISEGNFYLESNKDNDCCAVLASAEGFSLDRLLFDSLDKNSSWLTPELPLSGRELMAELQLVPGPEVGAVLLYLAEVAAVEPLSRSRALELAATYLSSACGSDN